MKINRRDLEQALLLSSLRQFEDVPPEDKIDHVFSERFENWVSRIGKKSETAVWRCWRSPIKRAAIIAVMIVLLLGLIACTPPVRKALVKFFMKDSGESYEITFESEAAATVPHEIRRYRVPQYEPEGYFLVYREGTIAGVEFLWINEEGGTFGYSQSPIPEDGTDSSWIGIDSTDVERETATIDGYKVEIVYNDDQYIAIWTDDLYLYMIDLVGYNIDPINAVTAMIESIVEVATVEPLGQ